MLLGVWFIVVKLTIVEGSINPKEALFTALSGIRYGAAAVARPKVRGVMLLLNVSTYESAGCAQVRVTIVGKRKWVRAKEEVKRTKEKEEVGGRCVGVGEIDGIQNCGASVASTCDHMHWLQVRETLFPRDTCTLIACC